MILRMARRYIKAFKLCNDRRDDDDDVEIAATIVIVGMKRQWGGSTQGHKTYMRDREGAVLTRN
jgi:hypothetical protein